MAPPIAGRQQCMPVSAYYFSIHKKKHKKQTPPEWKLGCLRLCYKLSITSINKLATIVCFCSLYLFIFLMGILSLFIIFFKWGYLWGRRFLLFFRWRTLHILSQSPCFGLGFSCSHQGYRVTLSCIQHFYCSFETEIESLLCLRSLAFSLNRIFQLLAYQIV